MLVILLARDAKFNVGMEKWSLLKNHRPHISLLAFKTGIEMRTKIYFEDEMVAEA